ncbi:MAG: NADH-quinone oxidoreductase subunit J [Prevotella sp.]|nr:NADH-quinone oxidoreductase subunit J [Prevotella sp.]
MGNIVVFGIIAVVILGAAVLSVLTTSIMRAATFLLVVLLGIAGLYFILDYTFLGAAQICVYAGGITMVYIFAIQLVNKRTLQAVTEHFNVRRFLGGAFIAFVGLVTVVGVMLKNRLINMSTRIIDKEFSMSDIGNALMGSEKYQYVLPFEFISVFLLACIIGAIVISRKE